MSSWMVYWYLWVLVWVLLSLGICPAGRCTVLYLWVLVWVLLSLGRCPAGRCTGTCECWYGCCCLWVDVLLEGVWLPGYDHGHRLHQVPRGVQLVKPSHKQYHQLYITGSRTVSVFIFCCNMYIRVGQFFRIWNFYFNLFLKKIFAKILSSFFHPST